MKMITMTVIIMAIICDDGDDVNFKDVVSGDSEDDYALHIGMKI